MPTSSRGAEEAQSVSGRVLVAVGMVALLVVWGSLNVAFRQWKERYRARATLGATVVAGAIDPLAAVVPPDESPVAWRQAVADTHAMLETLTAANVLDLTQMNDLGARIKTRVASSKPENSRTVLAGLWDEIERQAGPIIGRHPRPRLLVTWDPREVEASIP
jgi:hypothetical protein